MKRKRKADSTVAKEIKALAQAHREYVKVGQYALAGRVTCEKEALEWASGLDIEKPSIAHRHQLRKAP